jgi:hypothetical protein
LLESKGIPAVAVGTEEFAGLLQLEAEQRGLPDLRRVIVPHPLGGMKEQAIRDKAEPAVEAAIAGLTSPAP